MKRTILMLIFALCMSGCLAFKSNNHLAKVPALEKHNLSDIVGIYGLVGSDTWIVIEGRVMFDIKKMKYAMDKDSAIYFTKGSDIIFTIRADDRVKVE